MKATFMSILIAVILIGGAFLLANSNSRTAGFVENANNVTIENGKQIIEISARGGYYPQKSTAKAGIPTVLRFRTSSTFDCSASVRIPSLDISKLLPQTGVTDIELGSQQVATLDGSCGMGMYPFEVIFTE